MFAKEKLVIRFNLFFRNIFFHLLFWYASLLLFAFLTGYDQLFCHYVQWIPYESIFITNLVLAASIAVLFSFNEVFFSDRFMRASSLKVLQIVPVLYYLLLGFILAVIAPYSPKTLMSVRSLDYLLTLLPTPDIHLFRFLGFFYLACIINAFLKKMRTKVGKGNFRGWAFGAMNKPREHERIFMFIDMKSSTRIAEQLSHEKFSHLVQDIFNDMAIVDNYMGEIYQYLGDGAIISWSLKNGLKNNNFLKAYYGFTKLIEKRDKYYQKRYGLSPKFKAGMHVGKVMVLQVGRIRRDISYNGDTLNTTARIESMCNEYNRSLLISGDLSEMMAGTDGFVIKEVGNLRLKGKRRKVDVMSVREKKVPAKQSSPKLRNTLEKLTVYKTTLPVSEQAEAC